jgi:phospholipid/cholesterol/gamma-HCH transport system permease protein
LLLGTVVAIGTGFMTAYIFFDIRPDVFFNLQLVDAGDVALGCIKAVAYGAAIPIVSSHAGFSAHGGSEGVGWATTRAVVNSSLAILTLNATISAAGFVVFP